LDLFLLAQTAEGWSPLPRMGVGLLQFASFVAFLLAVSVLSTGTMRINDTSDLGHCSLKLIVDHYMVGNSSSDRLFSCRFGEPFRDDFIVVTPASQTSFLHFPAGWLHEDQHRIGVLGSNLLGALHINFQHHITPVGRVGHRGSVEIAEDFGMLDKPVGSDMRPEGRSIDELIGVRRLVFATSSCGPGPTQPQGWV
jgi:hypothetical protein